MRTIVYVDGYNLYYGLLRKSRYKWLDLYALFADHVLDETAKVIEVRYYTAPVLGRMSDSQASPQRQRVYLQALRKYRPQGLSIVEGRIVASTPFQRLYRPIPELPHLTKVQVYDFNEKKTDVNLATDMLTAAWTQACEQIVLCSNDTDLEGALTATTTVGSNGTWSVTGVASNLATGSGSNAFYAKQMDALGNVSALSNSWTVTSTNSGNQLTNGDLSLGTLGATGNMTYAPGLNQTQFFGLNGNSYTLFTATPTQTVIALTTNQNYGTSAGNTTQMTYQINYNASLDQTVNPGGLFSGNYFGFNAQSAAYGTFWSQNVSVVAGQTYNFSIDYIDWNQNVRLYIGNAYVGLWGNTATAGSGSTSAGSVLEAHGWGTYTATTTGTLALELRNVNGIVDFQFDNLYFGQAVTPANGTLAAGSTAPFTPNPDGTSTAITYTGGMVDMLAGDDVLNIGTNAQTLLGTAGNLINGNTGIDTLKLAANTTLNLVTLTNNQTVKPIEQVEVFELQGGSSLTVSANNVLSLGMANAFASNGKVQFMVNGTGSDSLSLQNLLSDGVGGNSGLTGMWASAGTATYGGNTYNLYNHSTTGAQVWVKSAITSVTLSASPLVIDLNGDGVQTTALANGVQFDLMATGIAQSAGWVDRHDGLLAIDLNGDGTINSGAELLGSSTRLADGTLARDGWQALAQYDTHADGKIDLSDAVFNQLRVWVDANGDGITDAGELHTLADVGVQSIGLTHSATQTAQNGNILDGMATVQHTDGSTTQMTDAWLNVQQQPVLNLDAVAHANGVVDLSNGQAQVLQINAGDVLQLPTNASGQHVLQVQGDSNDTVNLSKLFADGHAQGEWTTSGTTTQNGHTYNVYQHSGDASLQVLIDQHIVQSNVHLS